MNYLEVLKFYNPEVLHAIVCELERNGLQVPHDVEALLLAGMDNVAEELIQDLQQNGVISDPT